MTENENKYAEAYKKEKERYNGSLPTKAWDNLSSLREELGLTFWQGDRITKIVDSVGIISIHPMRVKGDITLSNMKTNGSDPYSALMNEIDKFSNYAEGIVAETNQLIQKTDQLVSQIGEIGSIAADIAMDKYRKGEKREAKAIGGTLLIVGIASFLYEKYTEAKLTERQERQMAELLQKKQEMANLKLANIQRQCKIFRDGILKKSMQFFMPELEKTITLDEDYKSKLLMFKRGYLLVIKSLYLVKVLEYVENEMQAWLDGKQSSDELKPLIAEIVDDTIYTMYEEQTLSRDEIKRILNGATTAKLASVFILSEPYLMRRHVGIKLTNSAGYEHDSIFAADHYGEPLILSAYNSIGIHYDEPVSYHIKENGWTNYVTSSQYYNTCKKLISDSFIDVPIEGVVPLKKKITRLIGICFIIIIAFCFGTHIGIISTIWCIILYNKEVNKLKEKFYKVQRHNYIIGAAQTVLAGVDEIETNKL